MSQNKVYQALREIGGEGTTTELRGHLSEKFPDSSLANYATNRVRQLEDKGVVEVNDDTRPFRVKITDDDWDGIRDTLADRDFPPKSEDEE